jgi:ribosomal protein S27AE
VFKTFFIEVSPSMSLFLKLIPRLGGPETRTFRSVAADVLGTRQTPCPACGRGTLIASPVDAGARICDACGEAFPLEVLRQTVVVDDETAAEVANANRREALVAFVTADVVAIGSAAWSIAAGGLPTLLGGAALALLLAAFAATARYRAWQVESRRLFEARPPLGDWLRAELGGR